MADNKLCLGLTVTLFGNDKTGGVALIKDKHCAGCTSHWNNLFYYQQMMTLVNQRRELQAALRTEHDRVLELETFFANNQPGDNPDKPKKGLQIVEERIDEELKA